MSAIAALARRINYKYSYCGALAAISIMSSSAVTADPAISGARSGEGAPMAIPSMDGDGHARTIGELRTHAATIADLLDVASERVERLARTDADKPALVEAIRHKLSLSRRWNHHLGMILDDVAEARRALRDREREAAKEIARMTALAEEARLELITLKRVLTGQPEGEAERGGAWSEGRHDPAAAIGVGRRLASNGPAEAPPAGHLGASTRDLEEVRARLLSLQQAQTSVASDVDAVRAKIIEALQTLAVHGHLPSATQGPRGELSSKDITAWAASMATKLNNRDVINRAD